MKSTTLCPLLLATLTSVSWAQTPSNANMISSIACEKITTESISHYKDAFGLPDTEWGTSEVDLLSQRIFRCFPHGDTAKQFRTQLQSQRDKVAEVQVDLSRKASRQQQASVDASQQNFDRLEAEIKSDGTNRLSLMHTRGQIVLGAGLTANQQKRLQDELQQALNAVDTNIQNDALNHQKQQEQAELERRRQVESAITRDKEVKLSQLNELDGYADACRAVIQPIWLEPDNFGIKNAAELTAINQLFSAGAQAEGCEKLSDLITRSESQRSTMMSCRDAAKDGHGPIFTPDRFLQFAAVFNQLKQLGRQQQQQKDCH